MARGGYRVGSGRKKKLASPATEASSAEPPRASVSAPAKAPSTPRVKVEPGATPLDYMLAIINDDAQPADRRDRMAIAAAPFIHPRIEKATASKRDAVKDAAEKAASGKFAPGAAPKLVVNNAG